ncbi:MAG: hypothetical protein IJE78_05285 [Bacteroidaceae bacterium]|nr:hypothetical protein [Bacteroidaceae bacterium]
MILTNYWNYYMNSQLQNGYQGGGSYYIRDDFDCLSMVDGEPLRVCIGGYRESEDVRMPKYLNQIQPLKNLSVVVGTGTSTVDPANYQLGNDITSSLLNVQTSVNISVAEAGLHIAATISGTNTTGSSIAISEIGIYKKVFSQIYDVSTPTEKVLFVRHLLTSPKSVGNNETFSLTFEWVES